MKNILFLLFLFFGLNSFAQSRRKVNEQLTREVALAKLKYDSIVGSGTAKWTNLNQLQVDFAAAQLRNQQRQATNIRNDLGVVERSYEQLIRLGKDPSRIVSLSDLKDEVGFFEFDAEKSMIYGSCTMEKEKILTVNVNTLVTKKLNRKEQNERLTQQLNTYLSANNTNLHNINEIDRCSTILVKSRPTLDSLYWKYEKVLYDLAIELTFLRDTIGKLRDFSLSDWPKNFTSVYEKEFGKPVEEVFIDEMPEGGGSGIIRYYERRLLGEYIYFANPIPIEQFSMEAMKKQSQVILKTENAQFPGGLTEMRKFLMKNLRYPPNAEESGIQGKCYLKFKIFSTGEVSEITVMRGVSECPECDKEAVRVVRLMPRWIPATEGGRKVDSYYQLPIIFKIQ